MTLWNIGNRNILLTKDADIISKESANSVVMNVGICMKKVIITMSQSIRRRTITPEIIILQRPQKKET